MFESPEEEPVKLGAREWVGFKKYLVLKALSELGEASTGEIKKYIKEKKWKDTGMGLDVGSLVYHLRKQDAIYRKMQLGEWLVPHYLYSLTQRGKALIERYEKSHPE